MLDPMDPDPGSAAIPSTVTPPPSSPLATVPLLTTLPEPPSLPNPAATGEEEPQRLPFEQAQPLLRALADPIRLQVMVALGEGERCVCALTDELGVAQSKLSFHLRVMRQAGLIAGRQQGRWTYYRLQPTALVQLRDWLDQLAAGSGTPAHPCS